jgi:hypothetical protein
MFLKPSLGHSIGVHPITGLDISPFSLMC